MGIPARATVAALLAPAATCLAPAACLWLAASCAVPPAVVGDWAADTGTIARAVDGDARVAGELAPTVAAPYRDQARAWRALEDYARTVSAALTERQPTARGVAAVQRAFLRLHLALEEAVADGDLGLDRYAGRITLTVGEAMTPAQAVRTLHPVIAHMVAQLAGDARRLEQEVLARLEREALAGHAARGRETARERERLLARRALLEDRARMHAAGAGSVEGDPAAELERVRTELDAVNEAHERHAAEGAQLQRRWERARQHARDTRLAYREWIIAHRELARALAAGEERASMRLLRAAARDHARH